MKPNREALTSREQELFREELEVVTSDEWIVGDRLPMVRQKVFRSIHKEDGGLIRVSAKMDVDRRIVKDILITGDFFMRPKRALYDLEASLKNKSLDDIEQSVQDFFAPGSVDLMVITPDDFVKAIHMAVDKIRNTPGTA